MSTSKIEWLKSDNGSPGKTWNPITGCTPISEGCDHCYASRMSKRLAGRYGYPVDIPFMPGNFHVDKLDEPLRWKKPSRIFVCSMGDLFHEAVPFALITDVFDVMCSWRWPNKAAERDGDESLLEDPGHTFIVLTKRPTRVLEWRSWLGEHWPGDTPVQVNLDVEGHFGKHIWLGVTAENQQRADERVPILLQIPAAVRFVSVEPMLGPVDLDIYLRGMPGGTCRETCDAYDDKCTDKCPDWLKGLDWVICGGETGPGARPMQKEWARSLKDQCVGAGVPFFFKSWGEWVTPEQMPLSTYREIEDYGTGVGYAPVRVGKKRSGCLIDGREWNIYPEVTGL